MDKYTKGILTLIALLLIVIAAGVWYPQLNRPATVADVKNAEDNEALWERVPFVAARITNVGAFSGQ